MHKQHPQTAYRKYAVLIGAIFENCDKKSRQPILKLPTSFEAIGTVHQFICDGVKRPAWRTISANQPNHNRKIQHKCNAQQYHQKFFHTLFSFCLMIPSLFCPHYTDLAGRYGCPSYTCHKKRNTAFSFWMYKGCALTRDAPALIVMPDIVGIQTVRDSISLDEIGRASCRERV